MNIFRRLCVAYVCISLSLYLSPSVHVWMCVFFLSFVSFCFSLLNFSYFAVSHSFVSFRRIWLTVGVDVLLPSHSSTAAQCICIGVCVSGPCLMHITSSSHSLILSVSHIRKNVELLSVCLCVRVCPLKLLLPVDLLSSYVHCLMAHDLRLQQQQKLITRSVLLFRISIQMVRVRFVQSRFRHFHRLPLLRFMASISCLNSMNLVLFRLANPKTPWSEVFNVCIRSIELEWNDPCVKKIHLKRWLCTQNNFLSVQFR